MSKRVLVALSGGVDSTVSAFLLKNRGYDVVGFTMAFNNENSKKTVDEAYVACKKLAIKHIVVDCTKKFENEIIDNFVKEYYLSRTPNPCILCNKVLKFGEMLRFAIDNGFSYLATGHYAKIISNNGKLSLSIPRDKNKDQTYFLYQVFPRLFSKVIFPLANLKKAEVKKIAHDNNFFQSSRESYSACFLPERNLYKFLQTKIKKITSGDVLDVEGSVIGQHKGALFYTVGQRSGLTIKKSVPLYVLHTDVENNILIVGGRDKLRALWVKASSPVFWSRPENSENISAKIRHSHKRQKCKIFRINDNIIVKFDEFVETISPGQSIVFYDGFRLIGGAILESVVKKVVVK